MTSLRARLHIRRVARDPDAVTRIPPVFVLGVVMITVVVGGLMLRSVLAARGSPIVPTGTSSAGASLADSPAVAISPAGAEVVAAGSSDPASSPGQGSTAVWTASPNPALKLTGYIWPLDDPVITLPFGPSDWGEYIVNGQHFHDGLDIASACGDYVHAAHDGVVLAASRQYDDYMGWTSDLAPYYHLLDTKHWWDSLPIVIVIDDGDGYRSIYAHEYQVTVKPGQHVTAGQVIGYEGATGNATGCHVHFGLFSPTETATFQLDPTIVAKDLMPPYEIARIDPLLVLPFRCDIDEMRSLRPEEAAACPQPTPPSPSP